MTKRKYSYSLLEACKDNNKKLIANRLNDKTNDKLLFKELFTIEKGYEFPFQYLIHNDTYDERINEILKVSKPCKPITMKIPIPSKCSKLMKLGYKVINETRKIIINSWTHPSQTGKNKSSLQNMIQQRNENRRIGNLAKDKIFKQSIQLNENKISLKEITNLANCDETEFILKLSDSLRNQMLDAFIQPSINTKIGNCQECVMVAFQLIRNLSKHVQAEMMYLDLGDHIVLILDDKVVVDPWFGTVYLKRDISSKMMTYIEVTSSNGICFNICANAKVGTVDTLKYYSLSPSGLFRFTCCNDCDLTQKLLM